VKSAELQKLTDMFIDVTVLVLCGAETSLVGGVVSGSHAEKNQPEEKDVTEQIVLSPSIKYAGSPRFAPKFE